MLKQTKQVYQAPTITVVEMKVERGFQGTNFTARDLNASSQNGTETYIDGTAATGGWF